MSQQLPPPPPGCADWRAAYAKVREAANQYSNRLELPELGTVTINGQQYSPSAVACYAAEEQRQQPQPQAFTLEDLSELRRSLHTAQFNSESQRTDLESKVVGQIMHLLDERKRRLTK